VLGSASERRKLSSVGNELRAKLHERKDPVVSSSCNFNFNCCNRQSHFVWTNKEPNVKEIDGGGSNLASYKSRSLPVLLHFDALSVGSSMITSTQQVIARTTIFLCFSFFFFAKQQKTKTLLLL
jgi:hypothetical protein